MLLLASLYIFLAIVAHATGKPEVAAASDIAVQPRAADAVSATEVPPARQVHMPRDDLVTGGRQLPSPRKLEGTRQRR